MGLRAYRAGRMVAEEARAMLSSVSKNQQAIHKETQELAERLDRSGNARRAESMGTQVAMAAAEHEAARAKSAAAAASMVATIATASTVTLSLAAQRQQERRDGSLAILEGHQLRRQAGLKVEPLERPRRPGDEPASYQKVFDATLGTAANWLRGLGRGKADQAEATDRPGTEARHLGAPSDGRRLELMGDLAEARRRREEAGAKVQASVGESFVYQLIVYGMYLHAENRLRAAEEAWDDWVLSQPDLDGVPPATPPAEPVGRGNDPLGDDRDRPTVAAIGPSGLDGIPNGGDPASHDRDPGMPQRSSARREATLRPGPLPPSVPGLPPPAGVQERPIIQAPVELVRAAMPPPPPTGRAPAPNEPLVPAGSVTGAAPPAVIDGGTGEGVDARSAVSPPRPPAGEGFRPPPVGTDSPTDPGVSPEAGPGHDASRRSTIDGRAQAHLQRWRDEQLRLPLNGTRTERLEELRRRAAAGTLTPGELRSNADLFSPQERTRMEGLLRADIGAAYIGGQATSLTAERLDLLAGEAAGVPPLAVDDERVRSMQVSLAALDLVAASEEVANGGGEEALARQHAARARYEDALYGTPAPDTRSAAEREWRQFVSEVQIAMGAGDYGPAAMHAMQNLAQGLEDINQYEAEARAQAERLAMAKKALAAAEAEQAMLTINPKQ